MFEENESGFYIIPKKILNYYNFETIRKNALKEMKLVKNSELGYFSHVYQLNDKECLKIFKIPRFTNEIEKFSYFSRCNIDGCVLPKRLYSIKRMFYGYSMDYVDGVVLKDLKDIDYSYYIKAAKKILTDTVRELSENGIKIDDSNDRNIMYDSVNKCFKLIDCDYWQSTNEKYNDLRLHNYKSLNFELTSYLFGSCYILPKIDEDYVECCEERRLFLEDKYNYKIKTINDSRKFRKW